MDEAGPGERAGGSRRCEDCRIRVLVARVLQNVVSCTFVLVVFSWGMTRGEVLRYALAFALRRSRKIVRGLKHELTEYERYAVADHVVMQLKQRGDLWRLNEDAPTAKPRST
jgi:hypothetical protein